MKEPDWNLYYNKIDFFLYKTNLKKNYPYLYEDCKQHLALRQFEYFNKYKTTGDLMWFFSDFLRLNGIGKKGKKSQSCIQYVGEEGIFLQDNLSTEQTGQGDFMEDNPYIRFINELNLKKGIAIWAIKNYKKLIGVAT